MSPNAPYFSPNSDTQHTLPILHSMTIELFVDASSPSSIAKERNVWVCDTWLLNWQPLTGRHFNSQVSRTHECERVANVCPRVELQNQVMSESWALCKVSGNKSFGSCPFSLLGDGNGIQPSDSAGGGGLLLRSCFCMKEILPNKRHGDESRGAWKVLQK